MNQKQLESIPKSLSAIDRLRCALYLADPLSQRWLAGFFEQVIYDEETKELGFNLALFEGTEYSHKMEVGALNSKDFFDQLFQTMKDGRMIWCGLWMNGELYPAWIYAVQKRSQTCSVLTLKNNGVLKNIKRCSQADLSRWLFAQQPTVTVYTYRTQKTGIGFPEQYLQMQTYFFLKGLDFVMLQKDCSNKKFGLQAIREALLGDLKNGTISKKNYLLLYDHLRFMRYRIVLWKQNMAQAAKQLEQFAQEAELMLRTMKKELTEPKIESFVDITRQLHEKQYDLIGGKIE